MSRYFTKEHEWVEVEGETATVGITDYAQGQLGDITFVELPALESEVRAGAAVSVVDSVKAASDVYAPVSGRVRDINEALEAQPELVNSAAESKGWLFRVTLADAGELAGLMDREAYDAYVAEL